MFKTFKHFVTIFVLSLFFFLTYPTKLFAEYKSDIPSGQNIPKLEKSPDDPKLVGGHVYPNWGPICQRYTYSVLYLDDQNRPPEYVKIYFNGTMLDMEKEDSENSDYFRGVKYVYKFVPNKLGSNFFFFEASNGLGKTRSNIIDSPDNGPVLFKNAFDKNEVAVIDAQTKTKILSYDLKDEWVGGVALSDDGKYLAVKTHKKIYLFDTSKPSKPLWIYEGIGERPGDVKGGIDISGDGTKIIASIGGNAILFNNQNNQPIWVYKSGGNQAYNVAISKDGKYMAMGTAGSVISTAEGYTSSLETNLLLLWNEKSEVPLWQYHAEGNFHDVSLSDDGSYITGATGCPDRRFYLFSKDSNIPLIKSEMLTRDSPVHRAKISGDGQFAAVGSESNDGAVFLFSQDSDSPVWKFPMPQRSSARALNFTSDGAYIGAATFKGDAYIFNRNSSTPISHWNIPNVSFGGIDIAEDGSFIAAGGNDNQLHVFQSGSDPYSVKFNEYVEEVDISANGRYIAAGTGGSVYFFEANDENAPAVECQDIKEPPSEERINIKNNINANDVKPTTTGNKKTWPSMLFSFSFLGSLVVLAVYLLVVRYKKIGINKKIIFATVTFSLLALILIVVSTVINTKNNQTQKIFTKTTGPTDTNDSQETGCGNGMCEPNFGETEANCSSDCSGSN